MKRRKLIRNLDAHKAARDARRSARALAGLKFYPADAPGIAPPGPSFMALAAHQTAGASGLNQASLHSLILSEAAKLQGDALRNPVNMPVGHSKRSGASKLVSRALIPGHIWGSDVYGPTPCDVMVIGKQPGQEEVRRLRNLVGPTGEYLEDLLCREASMRPAYKSWYVTNLVRFLPLDDKSRLSTDWIADCLPLLQQELCFVRPKYILCLGADAVKAILGKSATIDGMEGRVVPHRFTYHVNPEDPPLWHTSQVMSVLHPAQALRRPEYEERLLNGLARFCRLTDGEDVGADEHDIDHREIRDLDSLRAVLAEASADCPDRVVAVDAEWHGSHPQNDNAYVRTVQFSWAHKKAACVVLRAAGGGKCFEPNIRSAIRELKEFFEDKRVVGHFLVSDLEFLVKEGLDLRKQYSVPLKPRGNLAAWERTRREGGGDTAIMLHALDETARFGLEHLSIRYTSAPRYDIRLETWKKQYCAANKIKPSDLDGYGACPAEILIPYACLHGDSLVQLADGNWAKIRELVRDRYSGKVKAFLDGRVVDARVTNWHRNAVGQDQWFKLFAEGSLVGRHGLIGPALTPDHKVLTQRGKVRVDQLKPGSDSILTEETEFSADQLSVFLGCLLGDGGYTRKNDSRVGFNFSQRFAAKGYVDWKAEVFSTHGVSGPHDYATQRRYTLHFSRYLKRLSQKFRAHTLQMHGHRKGIITKELLSALGDLGLAVWYQDDGSLVLDKRSSWQSSRIYAHISRNEQLLVVDWLSSKFGEGVTYNRNSHFIQFSGKAFEAFHSAIGRFIHPDMAYKTVCPVEAVPVVDISSGKPFYDRLLRVVPYHPRSLARRGSGVRYCLTVEKAGNFLTQVGFVSNCYDSDVTRRIWVRLNDQLDSDINGNCCREAYWRNMAVQPAVYEINTVGIPLDMPRVASLTRNFSAARTNLESDIKQWARWPDFNIRSHFHVRELLFGEALNGKKSPNNEAIRQRPPEGRSLNLMPVYDTSKTPIPWSQVIQDGETAIRTPATGKEELKLLAQENPKRSEIIGKLRDCRFIDQVIKTVLKPPTGKIEPGTDLEDMGYGGLAGFLCDDGRLRTHIYTVKETGRWSSSRPALMNLAKNRDDDYTRILGKEQYKHKLRSLLRATRMSDRGRWTDEPCVLVESDFTGAELAMMAWLSGDKRMINHVYRNGLPETHKDYYDIHSNIAKLAFRLDCEPTKKGLQSVGKGVLRNIAKTVIFGVAYGRGAKAIVIAAKEQGVNLTEDESQGIIDAIFEMYPGLRAFYEECRERAVSEGFGWLCNAFGRFRRFPRSSDNQTRGEQERQAMNFPVQGGIADAMSQAIVNLMEYRRRHNLPDMFRIVLQIHDAVLLEVPVSQVVDVVDKVIPDCLVKRVPIYPCRLDGLPLGTGPYHLSAVTEVFEHWGEALSEKRCKKLGLPLRFAVAH